MPPTPARTSPRVQEHCLAELAVVRRVHPLAARKLVADALDLHHRLPLLWRRVRALEIEAWLARKIATATRDLDHTGAALVDAAVADAAGESAGRILDIVAAKIIEADPDTHQARLDADRRRRYVALGQTDEFGLRLVIARVHAGDAVWVDAIVDRVADILTPDHPHDTPRDTLRSIAFGYLARPADLLRLLLEANAAGTDEPEESGPDRATALPADLLDALHSIDPARLRPTATLYLHLHEAALAGATGVARCEGLGPLLPSQVRDLLGHTHVTIKPVIDLADRVSVNAYEHPESLKERVRLTTPGDYFPHAVSTAGTMDFDHVAPYRPGGPPGQTGTHNSGPLTRTHHRVKTHARGWATRQLGPGDYAWRTPHGHYRLVDHRGTHPVPRELGADLFSDDPLHRALALIRLRRASGSPVRASAA